MTEPSVPKPSNCLSDDFFYFCLRLRKDRIRKMVADINARFPEESVEQRTHRLIDDETQLPRWGWLTVLQDY